MRPMPHWETHNPNGRSKYNDKQKKQIARNLQTPKKAPPRINTSQKETPWYRYQVAGGTKILFLKYFKNFQI